MRQAKLPSGYKIKISKQRLSADYNNKIATQHFIDWVKTNRESLERLELRGCLSESQISLIDSVFKGEEAGITILE